MLKNELVLSRSIIISWILLIFLSCTPAEKALIPPEDPVPSRSWYIPDGPRQLLRERTWDLDHQKLWVRFDFEREQVLGKTELLFHSKIHQRELVLDAKTMEFDSLYHVLSGDVLDFVQDSSTVTIIMDRDYEPGDTLVLGISFVSTPPNRGLYFVNPRGEDPVKPTQIWTLGQPEDNSFWYPTVDHPAERATQEVWIAVPPGFTTLSNGLLLESRILPGDSLRTDYWRLHQPHAPYLLALAVGEYEVAEEIRDGILYRYYTEPRYAETVHLIYRNTVEMLQFSEEKTGVRYPWDPVYAQVPVHDFIARGMENTTATILFDAVQLDKRASQDISFEQLIMHEIIHQWLGNLVTCKDWANLPLNEGFANYFESAWILHSQGEDAWLWKNRSDRMGYFAEAEVYRRPVIFDRYRIPEDMYDRHTYQKAGQILRMLHDYLGDELWWQGVNLWLEKFSFESVDIDDLQGVYEMVSNKDLDWFFQQWFLEPGHPELLVSYHFESKENSSTVQVGIEQIQDTLYQPVYQLYPDVHFVIDGDDGSRTVVKRLSITSQSERFEFSFDGRVKDVLFDPDMTQLAKVREITDLETHLRRLNYNNILVRLRSLEQVVEQMDEVAVRQAVYELAENDDWHGIRQMALQSIRQQLDKYDYIDIFSLIEKKTYPSEKSHHVRMAGVHLARELQPPDSLLQIELRDYLYDMIQDTSYFVSASAIRAAGKIFPDYLIEWIQPYYQSYSYRNIIQEAIADALIESENESGISVMIEMAGEPGDLNYPHRLLTYLRDTLDEITCDDSLEQVKQLFRSRIGDPYPRYRMLAYEMVARMNEISALDKLRTAAERERISVNEREKIVKVIRILENEKELDNSPAERP